MIMDRVKKDLLPNTCSSSFVDPFIHKMSRTRDFDRRSDLKPLCIVSIPYVKRVSEKFKRLLNIITSRLFLKLDIPLEHI
jgi:hypothetical protein